MQCITIFRAIGDQAGVARNSWNLGTLYEDQGDLAQAAQLMQVCVDFEREIGHADAEKDAEYLARVQARLGGDVSGARCRVSGGSPRRPSP